MTNVLGRFAWQMDMSGDSGVAVAVEICRYLSAGFFVGYTISHANGVMFLIYYVADTA